MLKEHPFVQSIICLVIAVFMLSATVPQVIAVTSLRRNGEIVYGTIVWTMSSTGGRFSNAHVRVYYYVDGKLFDESIAEFRAGMSRGNEIRLFFDPQNPEIVTTGFVGSGSIVALGIGILILCVGIFEAIVGMRSLKKKRTS